MEIWGVMAMELKDKKGFTLVEVVVSLAILVVVAAVLMTGVRSSMNVNIRAGDILDAGYEQTKTLDSMINEGDASGGMGNITVTRNLKNVTFLSLKHIYQYAPNKIMGFTAYTSLSRENIDMEYMEDFYAGEDLNYPVETWGSLENFDPANNPHAGQGGGTNMSQTINNVQYGVVIKYGNDYYYVRENPWVTASPTPGNIVVNQADMPMSTFINGPLCVKINREKGFTTPGPNTAPGDQKLQNGIPYVFFPYGVEPPPAPQWYYNNVSFWYKLPPSV